MYDSIKIKAILFFFYLFCDSFLNPTNRYSFLLLYFLLLCFCINTAAGKAHRQYFAFLTLWLCSILRFPHYHTNVYSARFGKFSQQRQGFIFASLLTESFKTHQYM